LAEDDLEFEFRRDVVPEVLDERGGAVELDEAVVDSADDVRAAGPALRAEHPEEHGRRDE
jgi:hypothetical protein